MYHVLGWREGFAAVYASELTRDGIFDALRRKSCYATTAERILLEFRLNHKPMGSSITVGTGTKLSFTGTVGGTAPIERIELVRNGEVIDSVAGTSLIEHYTYEGISADADTYYYLRVTQTDGERAWSSPIWVCCE
jgi:hypothetical protein